MALSDALYELAARASAVEQNARESQAKGRADLEAKVAEARRSADDRADQLRAKGQELSGDADRNWNEVQRSSNEHVVGA